MPRYKMKANKKKFQKQQLEEEELTPPISPEEEYDVEPSGTKQNNEEKDASVPKQPIEIESEEELSTQPTPRPTRDRGKRKLDDLAQAAELEHMTATKQLRKNHAQIWKRATLPERIFPEKLSRYSTRILMTQSLMGWQTFGTNRPEAVIPVVREFYAGILENDSKIVTVRGRKVEWSPQVINQIWRLETANITDYELQQNNHFRTGREEVIQTICQEGAEWQGTETGHITIASAKLTPEAKVWAAFIKANILPTTHDTTLAIDRAFLIWSIIRNKSINIGKLISAEIKKCAEKNAGKLFFPQTITILCAQAGVQIEEGEETQRPSNLIEFLKGCNPEEWKKKKKETTTTDNEIMTQLKRLTEWCEKSEANIKAYWTYAKKRDKLLYRTIRGKASPTAKRPHFPSKIFKDWGLKDNEEAGPSQD